MDFFDILLAKKLEDDRDPTIEGLSVTENGTYREEGKAYSPVIVEVEPTLITKSITANGTYSASADNADGYSSVTVAVEGFKNKSIANTPTDIASFNDGTANPMSSLEISIIPQQDLHGYDNPWVGGAGKNKLNPINAENVTVNGVTFTVNEDGTITANGAAIANAACYIFGDAYNYVDIGLPAGNYVLNGGISSDCRIFVIRDRNGETTTFNSALNNVAVDIEEGDTFRIFVRVNADVTVNNVVFKPMLRLASETDPTFEPYSNICPISGWDKAQIAVADDLTTPTETHTLSIPFHDSSDNPITVYGGRLDVTSGELRATHANIASYNGETINEPWISSMDVYSAGATPTTGAQVVYPLTTPQTYQLTPAQVTTLLGQNNIFADCGQILEGEYFVTL